MNIMVRIVFYFANTYGAVGIFWEIASIKLWIEMKSFRTSEFDRVARVTDEESEDFKDDS